MIPAAEEHPKLVERAQQLAKELTSLFSPALKAAVEDEKTQKLVGKIGWQVHNNHPRNASNFARRAAERIDELMGANATPVENGAAFMDRLVAAVKTEHEKTDFGAILEGQKKWVSEVSAPPTRPGRHTGR